MKNKCAICEEGTVELLEEFDENNVATYSYICIGGCGAEYADAELVRKNKEVYVDYMNNLCKVLTTFEED